MHNSIEEIVVSHINETQIVIHLHGASQAFLLVKVSPRITSKRSDLHFRRTTQRKVGRGNLQREVELAISSLDQYLEKSLPGFNQFPVSDKSGIFQGETSDTADISSLKQVQSSGQLWKLQG